MKYEKHYIISEIIRTAKENGEIPLGKRTFTSETGIKESDWCGKYWTRWNDAIKESGYTPNEFQNAYEEKFLVEKLIGFIREIGHFPTRSEILMKSHQEPTFPSQKTFQRIGRRHQISRKIVEYCGKHEELIDIKDICLPLSKIEEKTNTEKTICEIQVIGTVYLMKTGKYYKIGRSNDADRRAYELRILMPEKLELIHKIKTDDPIGIEEYWHKRFKDKRKNGEWFELTRQDIEIFRRRKFM